ncbi:HdeD family acid-resistance protein [Catalinimonas sp. 4WD22]|uniref:HdeD family acid-resistance protein n=1 Tax=Catalinimonas locisalis TaxID=3133978 RepID=UPI003100C163
MLETLTKNWWMLAIKGVLLLLFGIFAFINPTLTAASLAIWFAALIIADGIFTIIAAIRSWQEREDKWLILAEGAISLILGLLLFITPGITLMIISFTIAFWFILSGISRIAMAIQLRKEIEGEGWLILGGILSVAFGLIIFAHPALGYGSLIWLIGFFALVAGLSLLIVSFKLRRGGTWIESKLSAMKDKEPA